MTYAALVKDLAQQGFTRVERDDRLLDIFTHETREKGVELWEKWDSESVAIIRVRLPYLSPAQVTRHILGRPQLEQLLYNNQRSYLDAGAGL